MLESDDVDSVLATDLSRAAAAAVNATWGSGETEDHVLREMRIVEVQLPSRWLVAWTVAVGLLLVAACISYVATAPYLRLNQNLFDYVVIFMSRPLALSTSGIAVAVVGYLFWTGEVAGRAALSFVAGLAMVWGSAQVLAVLMGLR